MRPMTLDGASFLISSTSTWRVLTRRPSCSVELNEKLTEFVNKEGRVIDREQFDAEFPFTP